MTVSKPPNLPQLGTIEIRVPGANCPWCFNEAMDRIRDLVGVAEVHASIHHQCIEVQHHGARRRWKPATRPQRVLLGPDGPWLTRVRSCG